jgi:hypothetical protein
VFGDNSAVVTSGDTTDIHLFNDGEAGRATLEGSYGFVRVSNGAVATAYLLDGEEIRYGGLAVRLPPAATGRILAAKGRELTLEREVSTENARRIYIEFPEETKFSSQTTYAIPIDLSTTQHTTSKVVLEEDCGFELSPSGDGGTYTTFPNLSFLGDARYRISRYRVYASE